MSIMISTPLVIGPGSVTAEMINSGVAAVGQVLTADGAGGADFAAPAGGSPGYLKYVALLSQTSTNAPVATVLENTIGTIVWSRLVTGSYRATLAGAFPAGKTWTAAMLGLNDNAMTMFYSRENNNEMLFFTYSGPPGSADAMDNWTAAIEIRVYP